MDIGAAHSSEVSVDPACDLGSCHLGVDPRAGLAGASRAEIIDQLRRNRHLLMWAEAREEAAVAALGDAYGMDPDADEPIDPRDERFRHGPDGTPEVSEFAACELGPVFGCSAASADGQLRKALTLRHRHPRLWQGVMTGQIRAWQANEILTVPGMSELTMTQASWLDAELAAKMSRLPFTRARRIAESLVIQADAEAAERRRIEKLRRQYVRLSRESTDGLTYLEVHGSSGDLITFRAMVVKVAEILAENGDSDTVGARQVKAIGILGNPARALLLLQGHLDRLRSTTTEPVEEDDEDPRRSWPWEEPPVMWDQPDPGNGDPPPDQGFPEPIWDPDVMAEDWQEEPEPVPTTQPVQRAADPSSERTEPQIKDVLAGALASQDQIVITAKPARLLPKIALYVHLSEESLRTGVGTARIEGIGPATMGQVKDLLTDTIVKLTPVIDQTRDGPVIDRYEATRPLRERVIIGDVAETFPYGTTEARDADLDHTVAYAWTEDGEAARPGQTCADNLAAVGRRGHRAKTFGGWDRIDSENGVHHWLSPSGDLYRVDAGASTWMGRIPCEAAQDFRSAARRWPSRTEQQPTTRPVDLPAPE